jgi:hypothetical protein
MKFYQFSTYFDDTAIVFIYSGKNFHQCGLPAPFSPPMRGFLHVLVQTDRKKGHGHPGSVFSIPSIRTSTVSITGYTSPDYGRELQYRTFMIL